MALVRTIVDTAGLPGRQPLHRRLEIGDLS
jgi:hypothetical protein